MKSVATRQFLDLYHALPQPIKREARKAYRLFKQAPFHPSLHLERLRSDPDAWSARISRGYRAVGTKRRDTMIWFWIGSHSDFDRTFPA